MTVVYSIIKKSQLEGGKRLDAEYYQPEYFIDFSKGNWRSIGSVLKTCQYGLSLAMNDEKIGYPMFKMDNIDNAFLFDDNVRYAKISDAEYKAYKVFKDDIFFNRVNSQEFVGRTGMSKSNLSAVFASYLIRLQIDESSGLLPDYVNLFLNSRYGRKQIDKYARRAVNQANVNAQELKSFQIFIPKREFQNQIATLSSESWTKFEESKRLYQQAEQLLLEELGLKDFEEEGSLCNVVKLSEIKQAGRMDAEYFQSGFEQMKSRLKHIKTSTLGELATMKKGFEPGSEAYEEEGKLFIRVSSVSKDGITDKDQKYLSEKLFKEFKSDYQPKIGDILLTKDATPGVAYVVKETIEGVVSGGIMRLKLDEQKVDPEYGALCINSMIGKSQVERDAGGSIIAHWKPSQIKNMVIPVLSLKIQKKIAELVRESHAARQRAKKLFEEAKHQVEELIERQAK